MYRVHDNGVRGRGLGGMLACWGHVLSMPMLMPACTGGQTCRRAGGTANERLSGCNQMMAVEGPERVEVEQRTLSGRELSADWRSGPAGEHLVCREVGTGCQSPCKAAFLITSTGVLQRLHPQGCPGSLISLGCPSLEPCPPPLPYQSTRPLFPSLIDPFTHPFTRSQSIHQSPIVCHDSATRSFQSLLPGRPRLLPSPCSPPPFLAEPRS